MFPKQDHKALYTINTNETYKMHWHVFMPYIKITHGWHHKESIQQIEHFTTSKYSKSSLPSSHVTIEGISNISETHYLQHQGLTW